MLKTRKNRIIALSAAVLALIVAAYCLLRFGFAIDLLDRSGWNTKHGQTRYLDYYGRPQTGWKYIDGKLYYFAPDGGVMATGWQTVDGHQYYFGEDGVRATGWKTADGKTFYLAEDGKLQSGWCKIDQHSYYLAEDGTALTGWQELDGKRFCFAPDGKLMVGWHTLEGKQYYFTETGETLTGWVELDGVRHRFAEDGAAVTGWFEDETGKYYLNEDGSFHTGWLDLEQKRYYFREDGAQVTGWLTLEQDRYYLYADGTAAIGEVKIDGVSNFFSSTGKWVLMCNSQYPVPKDFVTKMANIEGFQFDISGRDALQKMMEDCRAAGFDCKINNTYRSKATQQYLWNRSVAKYMAAGMTEEQANKETGKDTMIPGHSEHQTGLAVDITGNQEMYDWLAEHCWEYGFILRYPTDKTDITGIIYEPWHFRYVGTELSLELKELGLCMEEYFASLTPKSE